ncbi:hypothetical protein GWK47_030949 [Chionoecetes opilio]|uniref:Uncharacterized protein n=1 Tax=Chionoecetes opilio TaxID=41210 RepID=A0A8J5D2B3_CHIOP|nr:hypothetical protein GWK47_030949 [Chionoecetes opilio]
MAQVSSGAHGGKGMGRRRRDAFPAGKRGAWEQPRGANLAAIPQRHAFIHQAPTFPPATQQAKLCQRTRSIANHLLQGPGGATGAFAGKLWRQGQHSVETTSRICGWAGTHSGTLMDASFVKPQSANSALDAAGQKPKCQGNSQPRRQIDVVRKAW